MQSFTDTNLFPFGLIIDLENAVSFTEIKSNSILTNINNLMNTFSVPCSLLIVNYAGADTGFPVGGGANPWGAPTYKFDGFSKKLHEIRKKFGPLGGRMPGAPPLDPPLL